MEMSDPDDDEVPVKKLKEAAFGEYTALSYYWSYIIITAHLYQ